MRFGNTYFGVNNFRNTLDMRFNFVSKYSKINVDSKNAIKKPQDVFSFLDKCIWIDNGKFSLLWRGY